MRPGRRCRNRPALGGCGPLSAARDGGVCGPDAVGEPVPGRPGRAGLPFRPDPSRLGLRCLGGQGAQAAALLCNGSLGGLAQVGARGATCPRPGQPAVPRRRLLRRRTGHGRGRQPRHRAAVPAMLPESARPGRAAGRWGAASRYRRGPCRGGGPCGCRTRRRRPPRCGHFRLGKRIDQAKDGAPASGPHRSGRRLPGRAHRTPDAADPDRLRRRGAPTGSATAEEVAGQCAIRYGIGFEQAATDVHFAGNPTVAAALTAQGLATTDPAP